MPFIVDTVQVEPENAGEYLRIIETEVVPVMTDAGARLVSCWRTSGALGEAVSVKTIWAFEDHDRWNEIRKNLVLDPRWFEYSRKLSALWTGGDRRFFYAAAFSPQT